MWVPYSRNAYLNGDVYIAVRHKRDEGAIVAMGIGWVCEKCHVAWSLEKIQGFTDDEMAARFEGELPSPETRIVWIEESDGWWHGGEVTGASGLDEGVLSDGRRWKKWSWTP